MKKVSQSALQTEADLSIESCYRPLPPPRLLPPLLPRLLLPDDEPEERDGGDTEPRELLPDERGATLLGREGRDGAALGRELDGRAGRALLPDGRREDDGLTPFDGCLELPGLTASPLGLRDVLLGRIASLVRVPVLPRVTDVRVLPAVPRVATERVEIRPFASRLIAVRDAVRVVPADRLERPVLTSMRERDADRTPLVRLSTIIVPG